MGLIQGQIQLLSFGVSSFGSRSRQPIHRNEFTDLPHAAVSHFTPAKIRRSPWRPNTDPRQTSRHCSLEHGRMLLVFVPPSLIYPYLPQLLRSRGALWAI
jgi:hypothetical protein